MVKHTQTIRRQFSDELFECVWTFCGVITLGLNFNFKNPWTYIIKENKYIIKENIFVFMKIKIWIKRKVNRRYAKIQKCRYINQLKSKNYLLVW